MEEISQKNKQIYNIRPRKINRKFKHIQIIESSRSQSKHSSTSVMINKIQKNNSNLVKRPIPVNNIVKLKKKIKLQQTREDDRSIGIEQKITQQQKLKDFYKEYGQSLTPINEPTRNLNQWDYIIKEMTQRCDIIQQQKRHVRYNTRKLSKNCLQKFLNQIKTIQIKQQDEEKKLQKLAYQMNRCVQKEYWKALQDILNFQTNIENKKLKQQNHQKKLQGFVSKQLQLGIQVAHSLQQKSNIIINLEKTQIGYKLQEKQKGIEKLSELQDSIKTFQQNKIKQPILIKNQLRDYQIVGLNWLATLHKKNINGILADEMGLGKTIQTISLLAYLAAEKGIWGPHLIIVPTSILINWEIELKRWCPALSVLVYFGTNKERKQKRQGWSNINFCNICITSYKLVIQDQKAFKRKRWYYIILDEAHQIKNFKSQRAQVLLKFKSKRRLLITGTPLQNDINELWSLMHFLMPNIFDSQQDFQDWFQIPMSQAIQKNQPINQEIIQKLHQILRPFLLRRLKKDVEKSLPNKEEVIIRCPLSRRQKYLYDEFIHRDLKSKSIKSNDFLGLMNCLMQLRKVCNHPNLFEERSTDSPFLLFQLQFIFPTQFHNVLKNISIQGLNFILQENQSTYQNLLMQKLQPNQQLIQIKLEQISQVGNFSQFYKKWEQIQISNKQQQLKYNMNLNFQRINFNSVIYGQELMKTVQINLDKPNIQFDVNKISFSIFNEFLFSLNKVIAKQVNFVLTKYNNEYQNQYSQIIQEAKKIQQPQYDFIDIRQKLSLPNKKLTIYDSGKLNCMVQLLKRQKEQNNKVIIFTQMQKMLDIFEIALNQFNFSYLRLDGSTKPDVRQKVVQKFNSDPKVFCFISSTRSGGIGINLTAANIVIFYDTDWNPAMDKQAQDRCHRIGQTKKVTIYRLISEFTIEENILLKSIQKRKLDEFIMDDGNFNTELLQKVSVKDLLGDLIPQSMNVNYQQYEQALEQVEDQEDLIKQNENEENEIDDEQINEIDIEKFPKIHQYGIRIIKNPIYELNQELIQYQEYFDQSESEEQIQIDVSQNSISPIKQQKQDKQKQKLIYQHFSQ